MNESYKPVPRITRDIGVLVSQELEEIGSTSVIDRIKGADYNEGENPEIADIIKSISKESTDPNMVLTCGAAIYRLLEKTFESYGQELPKVTKETRNNVLIELGETVEEHDSFLVETAERLREDNPVIRDYMSPFFTRCPDQASLIYVAIMTYALIEAQVINDLKEEFYKAVELKDWEKVTELSDKIDLEKELEEAVAAEEFEMAAVLRDKIRALTD